MCHISHFMCHMSWGGYLFGGVLWKLDGGASLGGENQPLYIAITFWTNHGIFNYFRFVTSVKSLYTLLSFEKTGIKKNLRGRLRYLHNLWYQSLWTKKLTQLFLSERGECQYTLTYKQILKCPCTDWSPPCSDTRYRGQGSCPSTETCLLPLENTQTVSDAPVDFYQTFFWEPWYLHFYFVLCNGVCPKT